MLAGLLALGACAGGGGVFSGFTPPPTAYALDDIAMAGNRACVAVQPAAAGIDPRFATAVESSLARHVAYRIGRVVDADAIRAATVRDGIDAAADVPRVALSLGCEAVLVWRPIAATTDYLVLWSSREVSLDVRLVDAASEHVLWGARHSVRRIDGGLPFTPVAAAVGAAQATASRYAAQDIPSMIDDVLRLIFATLPRMQPALSRW